MRGPPPGARGRAHRGGSRPRARSGLDRGRVDGRGVGSGRNRRIFESSSPTAVFCANDLLAIGVIHGLRGRGLRAPDDVAVVGYDDVELAAMTDPPLTTVHQPSYELGATAYELLRRGAPPEQRSFSPHLVQRESTGAVLPLALDDHDEPPRAVYAFDALQLDVRRRRRTRDEHERPPSAAARSRRRRSSGTVSTICSSRTTQTWRSGSSVSARLPCPGPPSSAIVPVTAQPPRRS